MSELTPEVLVVDDEPMGRQLLRYALQSDGLTVRVASGGQEAVEVYRGHQKTIDVVLLDVRMAGIEWGHSDAFLDEHPNAYKDIDVVMEDAADLVSVDHTLRQIVNVKGD